MEYNFWTTTDGITSQPESKFQQPRRMLTCAPFQFVDVRASLFKLPTDILNPVEGFEPNLAQTEEDGKEDGEDKDGELGE